METSVEVEAVTYRVAHAASADALIDEVEFACDEQLPYWAELWPSAVALARRIVKEAPAHGRAIELGCGVGLPSVAALYKGLETVATDYYPAALDFACYNAHINLGFGLCTRLLDWRTPALEGLGYFDLVLAADVLYEKRNVPALVDLIPSLLAPGGEVLIADPRRKDTPMFVEKMRERGFEYSTEEYLVSPPGLMVLVHRLQQA